VTDTSTAVDTLGELMASMVLDEFHKEANFMGRGRELSASNQLTVPQVRVTLKPLMDSLTDVQEMELQCRQEQPVVIFVFNAKSVQSSLLQRLENLIPQYTHIFDFYSVDCTEDVMPRAHFRQITEKFEIGELPCTLIFRDGQEAERANGSKNKEFSQIEDYLHKFRHGSHAPVSSAGHYVRLLSKPSGHQEGVIRGKFFQSMGKTCPEIVFEIIRIERATNSILDQAFRDKMRSLEEENRPSDVYVAFHATPEQNIERICRHNLSLAKVGATDKGYFGKGLYFSAHADYCARYIHKGGHKELVPGDAGKMIMFDILPGKQYQLSDATVASMGMERKKGFDSHVSPKKAEWVLFDPAQCVPRAVISFRAVESVKSKIGGGFEPRVK
ncbi:Elongation factor 1-beta, partial [Phlyctochytrium bullatum]